jgi:hypothetical protein
LFGTVQILFVITLKGNEKSVCTAQYNKYMSRFFHTDYLLPKKEEGIKKGWGCVNVKL